MQCLLEAAHAIELQTDAADRPGVTDGQSASFVCLPKSAREVEQSGDNSTVPCTLDSSPQKDTPEFVTSHSSIQGCARIPDRQDFISVRTSSWNHPLPSSQPDQFGRLGLSRSLPQDRSDSNRRHPPSEPASRLWVNVVAEETEAALPLHVDTAGRLPIEASLLQPELAMEVEPTQPATQPYWDPRRSSHVSPEYDDIICILNPTTPTAFTVVESVAKITPQHIFRPEQKSVQSDDEDMELEEELPIGSSQNGLPADPISPNLQSPKQQDPKKAQKSTASESLALALRMSSRVHDITLGYVFGRDPNKADILLRGGLENNKASGRHFRIFLDKDGILMIEDMSTNGTWVDGHLLRNGQSRRRPLIPGSEVWVVLGGDKKTRFVDKAKFVVTCPDRKDRKTYYEQNLVKYFYAIDSEEAARKKLLGELVEPPKPIDTRHMAAATSWYNHGMCWDGGQKYRIIGKVGNGAFATVYKVSTVDQGTIFAAKELDKSRITKAGAFDQKIYTELEIMKKLSHVSHMFEEELDIC